VLKSRLTQIHKILNRLQGYKPVCVDLRQLAWTIWKCAEGGIWLWENGQPTLVWDQKTLGNI